MLEMMLKDASMNSITATVTASTSAPVAGSAMTFTFSAPRFPSGSLYWAVIVGTMPISAFATRNGVRVLGATGVGAIGINIPADNVYANQTFRIGVGVTPEDAAIGAAGISPLITVKAAAVPNGQVNYLTAGTYSLTVPNFVKSLSVFGVGAGGAGGDAVNSYGGRAGTPGSPGSSAYTNIAVTPGEKITITVGTKGGTVSKGNGNAGTNTQILRGSTVLMNIAGGAGGIYAGGYGGGDGGKSDPAKVGVNIPGTVNVSPAPGTSGKGGDGGISSYKAPTAGVDGGVRIIWGTGRGFPGTLVNDM